MVLLYMLTWIPSIYPSHVSIFLPAPWILIMGYESYSHKSVTPIENGPFIVDFPIENGDFPWLFSPKWIHQDLWITNFQWENRSW